MATCAVVQLSDGLVVNKIVADPTDIAPDNCQLILIDEVMCDIGWTWNGIEFVNPMLPETSNPMPSGDGINGN